MSDAMFCLNFQKVDGVGDILCTHLTPNFDERLGQVYGMFHHFDNITAYMCILSIQLAHHLCHLCCTHPMLSSIMMRF